jgi:ABC-type bacteriocin/lantibiotic exporter with double-glycine peptidase domain
MGEKAPQQSQHDALYHQPRILFLDEGTAHLDSGNEQRIEEVLSQLHITRISVAHRPNRPDRIVWIDRTLNEMHGQRAMTVSDHPLKQLWFAPLPDKTKTPAA